MCDEAGDGSLAALKLIPDWSMTRKMVKKLHTALYSDDGLLFLCEDSCDVTFCCNKIGILTVNIDNINLDKNFDENDPDIIILIRFLASHSKFEKLKVVKLKISKDGGSFSRQKMRKKK